MKATVSFQEDKYQDYSAYRDYNRTLIFPQYNRGIKQKDAKQAVNITFKASKVNM